MKKILAIMLLISIGIFSCRKNSGDVQHSILNKGVNLVIKNGHLVFTSADDYADFLALSKAEENRILRSLEGIEGFSSFRDRQNGTTGNAARMIGKCDVPDSLIENNENFFSLLDQDAVLQIGDELYRYDYCGDRVWVISSTDAANSIYYADFMNGAERTNIVGYFPAYVDAIEAVAEGYTTMPDTSTVQGNEIFEKGLNFFGSTIKEHFFINNNPKNEKETNLFDGKLAYDKFAIYFHFYGKEKYQAPCFFNWCTSSSGLRDWNVGYIYKYRRKGRNYDNGGSGTLNPLVNGSNKVEQTFYEGSRGLRKWFAQWDVQHVYAKTVRIERNGGSAWFQITSYTLPDFSYTNNYYVPNSNPNHFNINDGY